MGVKEWVEKTKRDIDAIHKRSIEMLGEEMVKTKGQGGRMPFELGHLSRSLTASQQAMPKTSDAIPTGSNLGAVVATMNIQQPIYLGFTMNYARRREFGYVGADSLGRVYNEPGDHFVSGAIAQWPSIVQKAIKEIQGT